MRHKGTTALFISLLATLLCVPLRGMADAISLQLPERLSLRADRVSWYPDTEALHAEGAVRIDLEMGSATADRMRFLPESGRMTLTNAHLRLPSFSGAVSAGQAILEIERRRVTLFDVELRVPQLGDAHLKSGSAVCQNETCRMADVSGTLCGHAESDFRVSAKAVERHPSGAVTVRRAALSVREHPLITLPSLHLRPPGAPGFTAPILGFDAADGLVLGVSGLLPAGKTAFMEGSIAVRPLSGFETRTRLYTEKSDLRIAQLFHHPDLLLRVQQRGWAFAGGFGIASDIDWILGDRRIVDRLELDYLDRAATHTASRVRLERRSPFAVAELSVEALQDISKEGVPAKLTPLSPTVAVRAEIPLTPLGAHFFGGVSAEFLRRGPWGDAASDDLPLGDVPPHIRLALASRLAYVRRLGPTVWELHGAMRHQRWLTDGDNKDASLFIAGAAASVSAPLYRNFKNVRHRIAPYVVYRITPLAKGENPSFAVDRYDLLRTGHGIEAGVRTSLDVKGEEAATLDLFERFGIGGLGGTLGLSYLAFRARLGPPTFFATVDGAWDQRLNTVPVIGLSVHRTLQDVSVTLGVRRLATGDGPHRDQPFSTAFSPWLAAPWSEQAPHLIEVYQQGELPLSKTLALFAGARVQVDPTVVLNALWYGLRLHSPCRCIAATLTASHRVSTPVPDIYAAVQLFDW